jgi:hypothetical protein
MLMVWILPIYPCYLKKVRSSFISYTLAYKFPAFIWQIFVDYLSCAKYIILWIQVKTKNKIPHITLPKSDSYKVGWIREKNILWSKRNVLKIRVLKGQHTNILLNRKYSPDFLLNMPNFCTNHLKLVGRRIAGVLTFKPKWSSLFFWLKLFIQLN